MFVAAKKQPAEAAIDRNQEWVQQQQSTEQEIRQTKPLAAPANQYIIENEKIHFGAQKTIESLGRGTDNRFVFIK